MSEYSPVAPGEPARSVMNALLRQECGPLPPVAEFPGAGLYALYYAAISPHTASWLNSTVVRPVRGRSTSGRQFLQRLREHSESIDLACNLELSDFACRYLIVDPFWIAPGERLLIRTFRPLWNVVVDGFGNHDPGSGRVRQARSSWDTLHPGRKWAELLRAQARSQKEIAQSVLRELEATLEDC
jgi:hypothetical protein